MEEGALKSGLAAGFEGGGANMLGVLDPLVGFDAGAAGWGKLKLERNFCPAGGADAAFDCSAGFSGWFEAEPNRLGAGLAPG